MSNSEYPVPLLYQGIYGVLHPNESTCRAVHGSAPSRDGLKAYEDLPIIVDALAEYPEVRIMLTSTVPCR